MDVPIPQRGLITIELAELDANGPFQQRRTRASAEADAGLAEARVRALTPIGLKGHNLHGLRKLAAVRLAEAGCSAHEIAAITGHSSLDQVALYTREADQARLAKAAILRLQKNQDETA